MHRLKDVKAEKSEKTFEVLQEKYLTMITCSQTTRKATSDSYHNQRKVGTIARKVHGKSIDPRSSYKLQLTKASLEEDGTNNNMIYSIKIKAKISKH